MKKMLALLLALCMLLGLVGCGQPASQPGKQDESESAESQSDESEPVESQPIDPPAPAVVPLSLTAAPLPEFDRDNAGDTSVDVIRAINQFSFGLTQRLTEKAEDSLICSPLSVCYTLAALVNAAEGDRQAALLEAMGLAGFTPEQVNQGFASLLYQLTVSRYQQEDGSTYNPIQLANAVFVNQDYGLNEDFAQAILDSLRAETFSVDFTSDEAADAINDWCAEHTEGLIKEIVQELDPDTVAAVANAIYFSDRWDWEFRPEDNERLPFHGKDGDTDGEFMVRDGFSRYWENEELQAVDLRFSHGGGLYLLLPKDGADPSGLLTEEVFAELQENCRDNEGILKLPKFELDYDTGLVEALSALGLGGLFDSEDPMFTRFVDNGIPLYVSNALHKATIKVEETGTTAAAVTVMTMDAAGAFFELPPPFQMVCDHPFAFVLYADTYSGADVVLFTGVVNGIEG